MIRIDGVSFYDTGTWVKTGKQITITEIATSLNLVVTIGQKIIVSYPHVADPPGGGFTWIVFGGWDIKGASGSLRGSDLGLPNWGAAFTAIETWRGYLNQTFILGSIAFDGCFIDQG